MAENTQSIHRSRAILLFCGGFIVLGAIFLGSLYFSGQRGDQLQRLATTDRLKTLPSETKKPAETPAEKPKEKKEEKTEEQAPRQESAPSASTQQPTPPKPQPTQPVTPGNDSPSAAAEPIPATGGADSLWVTIPTVLILAYAAHEYRRSRRAVQRAAFHENTAF